MTLQPSPCPFELGFHPTEGGATIAVYAPYAEGIDLCLFDGSGAETRHPLPYQEAGVWHAFVPDVAPGQRYGLRARGEWDPDEGHLFNPAKLLLDPYARGLDGELARDDSDGGQAILSNDSDVDTAAFVPRGVLMAAPQPDAGRPAKPRTAWADTIVYEAHVKGLTRQLPGIPNELRGTYAALGHEAVISYLLELGVTALELLPIHAFADEPHLQHLGLTNYWGYSTLNFFTPHAAYASAAAREAGPQAVLDELRGAVDALHAAGIEVILDVVYNHTAEGGPGGRQVSWRGLANRTYYRHLEGQPGVLDDTTGTGNTLDFAQPRVVQLALDSLRYWTEHVGVDGFRYDLAATLGRTGEGFETHHPFLTALTTDPVLKHAKHIAEPWDTGLGGWQTGSFPEPMAEWNDRFRDSLRSFWLRDAQRAVMKKGTRGVRDLATRLAGSSDVFGQGHPPLSRGPIASVNFVTAHDGFTLHDLTAYQDKHNEANGEGGKDGSNNNRSWNHGAEGQTGDATVLWTRRRSMRNLMGSLFLSAGVPMLLAGDEFGRTQGGNNNAYCQDNEISWLDWSHEPWQRDQRATVAYLIGLRREHAVLRPTEFYEGRELHDDRRQDLAWFRASGKDTSESWWHDSSKRVLQMMRAMPGDEPDALIVINGFATDTQVTIPPDDGRPWQHVWDSDWDHPESDAAQWARSQPPTPPGAKVGMAPLTMRLYLSAE